MKNTEEKCRICAGLIRLCRGMNFFPTDPIIWDLLGERLHRFCHDHEHAKVVIDHWLDTEADAPKVVDLKRGAEDRRPMNLPPGCDICHGEPYVVLAEGRGAQRCTCARGRALAAA